MKKEIEFIGKIEDYDCTLPSCLEPLQEGDDLVYYVHWLGQYHTGIMHRKCYEEHYKEIIKKGEEKSKKYREEMKKIKKGLKGIKAMTY